VIYISWRYSSHGEFIDEIGAGRFEIRCDDDGGFHVDWDVIDGDADSSGFISDLDFFERKDVTLDLNVDRVCFD
jgi:hypothetical protein